MGILDIAMTHYLLWISAVLGGITAGAVAIIAILQWMQDGPDKK